ncbi:tetratricopeptide repeat protein [Acanthopleuribacter pedis]|uniref:Tetratricopeptide repeat protein n=1 Tax=Acanthopleuribacter pedis TaxID=442870 RepID=A0A8J7QNV2_9BACT|nr:tetratricopeptide repeat protein [Acanthopleuribacter pedis]MBO1322550.1 tetratricopeptide repeat protein [Acanthopleuribacter pedis]
MTPNHPPEPGDFEFYYQLWKQQPSSQQATTQQFLVWCAAQTGARHDEATASSLFKTLWSTWREARPTGTGLTEHHFVAWIAEQIALQQTRETSAGRPHPAEDDANQSNVRARLADPVPATIGRFRLETPLGEGGFGRVFLGVRMDETQQRVAVKMMSTVAPAQLDAFRQEARILARLQHPNIAHFLDHGDLADNRCWIAMEYVEGQPLDHWLASTKPNLTQRLAVFSQICDAVGHAHHHLIIHADLKPANILIDQGGRPKLLDFGIAAVRDPHQTEDQTAPIPTALTPAYAAPEQLLRKPLTTATDIYSLGVLLHQLLTGCPPKTQTLPPNPLLAHEETNPLPLPSRAARDPNLGIPPKQLRGDLDAVVAKATAREAEARYSSTAAMAEDLKRFLHHKPLHVRPRTGWYVLRKLFQRRPLPVALSAATLIGISLLLYLMHVQNQQLSIERDGANRARDRATAVTGFLVTLFEHTDPDLARGGTVSAMEVMELGRQRVKSQLAGDPETQVSLLTTMGRVFRALGRYPQSRELLADAMALAKPGTHEHEIAGFELIQTLEADGEYGAAKQRLAQLAAQRAPHHEGIWFDYHYAAGRIAFLLGRYHQAENAYAAAKPALATRPAEQQMRFMRDQARLQATLGFREAAVSILQELLALQQAHYNEGHSQLGQTHALLSQHYRILADYPAAQAANATAEAIYRQRFGDRHPHLIGCYLRAGRIHQIEGRFEAAEQDFKAGLALSREALAESHPLVEECRAALGELLVAKGRYQEAETLHREALARRLALFGGDHPVVARGYQNLGNLLVIRGDYAAAETLFRKALSTRMNRFGAQHAEVAESLENLAGLFKRTGNLDQAEDLYRQVLDLRRRLWPENHPSIATAGNNLALVLMERRALDEAEPLLRDALALKKDLFGPRHPDVASLLNNLALLLRRREDYTGAAANYREALALKRAHLDENHPDIARGLTNLGSLFLAQGDFEAATPFFLEALTIRRAAFGEEHPAVARAVNNLASVKQALGEWHAAEPLFRRSLEIKESVYEKNHPSIAVSLNNVGRCLREQGRYAEARTYYERALAMRLALFGEQHRSVALSHRNLGHLALLQGRFSEAARELKRAEEILRASREPAVSSLARLLLHEAELSATTDHHNAVHPLLDEALAGFKETLGLEHPTALKARRLQADAAFAMNQWDGLQATYDTLATKHQTLGRLKNPEWLQVRLGLIRLKLRQDRFEEVQPLIHQAAAQAKAIQNPIYEGLVAQEQALLSVRLGDPKAAAPFYQTAYQRIKSRVEENHWLCIEPLMGLAETMQMLGETEEMLKRAERANQLAETTLPEDHSYRAVIRSRYGRLLAAAGRVSEGEAMMRDAVDVLLTRREENHFLVREARARLTSFKP